MLRRGKKAEEFLKRNNVQVKIEFFPTTHWDQVICGWVDLLIKSFENSTEVHCKFDFMDRISLHVSCDHWTGSYCVQEFVFVYMSYEYDDNSSSTNSILKLHRTTFSDITINWKNIWQKNSHYVKNLNNLHEWSVVDMMICDEMNILKNSNILSDRECAMYLR